MTVRLIILLAGLCLGLLPSPASPPPECPSALDPIVFETLPEAQQAFLAGLFAHPGEPRAFCWSGPPDPQVAAALAGLYSGAESLFEFNDANHWTRTATNGSGLQRGDPVTITWGILPDGVMDTGVNPPVASSLVTRFDNQFGAGPGGSDLTQRPWFRFFAQTFERWGELIGVRYIYEPNDDGASFPGTAGVRGVRPDVRICARSIDGNVGNNIFGFNYFPDNGDMVLDTDNMGFMGLSTNDHVALRNLIAHEHGHGLGISHSCPELRSKLMEPTIATNFDGPQFDDLLSGHRGYGDPLEFPNRNDGPGTATPLGSLAPGDTVRIAGVSIDAETDRDWYALTLAARMRVSVTMTPVGEEYVAGPQISGVCSSGELFDALKQNDLGVSLYTPNGSRTLGSSVGLPIGNPEIITEAIVTEGPGTYLIQVLPEDEDDDPQMYELQVSISAGLPPEAHCRSLTVCSGNVSPQRFNQGSFDPDGDPITFALVPPPPYPFGETEVLFIVSDEIFADTCVTSITVDCQEPVTLASFTATRSGHGAQVAWEVTDRVNHAGFHLHRETDRTPRVRLTSDLLSGRDRYTFQDHEAPPEAARYWLEELSRTGESTWYGPAELPAAMLSTLLRAAEPNPFRGQTAWRLHLADSGPVRAAIFDLQGRERRILVRDFLGAGSHELRWDGRDQAGARAASGLYFLRVETGAGALSGRVVLLP